MSRRVLLLIFFAWFAGAGWHWAHEAAARPSQVIRISSDFRLLGVSPERLAVVERTSGQFAQGLDWPLEVWSLDSARKQHDLLQPGDRLVAGSGIATGIVCCERDRRFLVLEVATGNLLDQLPPEALEAAVIARSGGRILYATAAGLRLRDPRSQTDVWSNPEFSAWRAISQCHVIASHRHSERSIARTRAVRLSDGQIDAQFDSLQPLLGIIVSPDEQFAITRTATRWHVCQRESGAILWTMPPSTVNPAFSSTGNRVISVWADPMSGVCEASWETSTGHPLSTPPPTQRGTATRTVSPYRSFIVDSYQISPRWACSAAFSRLQTLTTL